MAANNSHTCTNMMKSPLRAVLFLILLVSTHALPMGSPHPGFDWEASMDAKSGSAKSTETSQVTLLKPNNFIQYFRQQRTIYQTSQDIVSSWADFLCRGSVTLGLFEAKHWNKVVSLQPKFIPLSLLEFGEVRRRRNCWEIPIEGGFLSKCGPKRGDRGKLTFQVSTAKEDRLLLETHIVDYRPWLVGGAPVPVMRKLLYSSTQSVVHGYITWRFHKAWQQKLRRATEP
jgi:hypothetical protein